MTLALTPAVSFTIDEAEQLYDECRFNCGPSALCAITGKRPDEILQALPQFRQRGYTNPKMMATALRSFGIDWQVLLADEISVLSRDISMPTFGLVRVQWDGPWAKPGVPIRARYRHTHWIAINDDRIFDINCMCVGGWVAASEWKDQVVPWLLAQLEKKSNGNWWPTHCWQLAREP